jgi:hypothetical protein
MTPRALPPNAAQQATNARLLTGDLEAWRQFALEHALANTGPVLTIYDLNGAWLAWGADVDVARGAIAGDTTFRVFLTGPDEYTEPRWTNYALATTGAEPYPAATNPLGVPAPDSTPTVAAGVDPTPSSFSIDILDKGDELATSWVTSPPVNQATFNSNVTQDTVNGNPAPSYKMAWRDYETGTYLYRNFGIAKANTVTMTCDFYVNSVSGRSFFWMGVQRDEAGNGVSAYINQVSSGQWVMAIGTGSGWGQGQNQNQLKTSAAVTTLAADTWFRLTVTSTTNTDGTVTVSAAARTTADADLITLTTTMGATRGDYCGFGAGFDQLGSTSLAQFDNIHVQAAGSTGYNPTNTATSYVYTFVNSLGEESAPSFASATILRPDGIAITVTTPTDIPTGVSAGYGVATKRIYRAVTGATGTAFRFVAEIPLAQADYVDAIPDTELGEVLESELWALPPADMRGMLALPNGVMAGFNKNQLCLSAQNHPHAWPVEYRLTVDTDIVAIGNIDTTVVICTENFVYLAIGTDPAAYSMTKLEVPQACVSKRSLAYLIGIGVVFASPDGLIAVAGNGSVRNLTSALFTRDQWQALVPESIVGVAHDDVYHFFYDNDPAPAMDFIAPFEIIYDGAAQNGGWAEIGLVFTAGDIVGESLSSPSESQGAWTVGAVTPPVPVWVRATVLSTANPGNVTFGGDAIDTWLSLTTNRTWRLDDVNQGGGSYLLGIQFSLSAGGSDPTPATASITHSLNLRLVAF